MPLPSSDPDPNLPDPEVVYADERVAVVNKPAGMLSVPGKTVSDSAVQRVRAMFGHARGPMVAHRLDMDTSGLLIFGLDPGSQRHLSTQFERRRARKLYIALVHADIAKDSGTIELPMRPDYDNRPLQIVDDERGQPSVTHYRVLSREIDRVRLALVPITGRTHQLRVHCAHPRGLGRAIVGDPLYGHEPPSHDQRLMLHASRLEIRLPGERRTTEFTAPVPF